MEMIEELEVANGTLTKVVDANNIIYIISQINAGHRYSSITAINKKDEKPQSNISKIETNNFTDNEGYFNYERDSPKIIEKIESMPDTFTRGYLISVCENLFDKLYLEVLVDTLLNNMCFVNKLQFSKDKNEYTKVKEVSFNDGYLRSCIKAVIEEFIDGQKPFKSADILAKLLRDGSFVYTFDKYKDKMLNIIEKELLKYRDSNGLIDIMKHKTKPVIKTFIDQNFHKREFTKYSVFDEISKDSEFNSKYKLKDIYLLQLIEESISEMNDDGELKVNTDELNAGKRTFLKKY